MPRPVHRDGQERFPHGPRQLESQDKVDKTNQTPVNTKKVAASPSPRLLDGEMPVILSAPSSVRSTRRKRTVVVSDRKVSKTSVNSVGKKIENH